MRVFLIVLVPIAKILLEPHRERIVKMLAYEYTIPRPGAQRHLSRASRILRGAIIHDGFIFKERRGVLPKRYFEWSQQSP